MSIDTELTSDGTPERPTWFNGTDASAQPSAEGDSGAIELTEADFTDWDGLEEEDEFEPDIEAEAEEPTFLLMDARPINDVILLDIDEADALLPGEQTAEKISWPAVVAAAVLHIWLITTLAGMTNEKPDWVDERYIDSRMDLAEIPKPEQIVEYDLSLPQENDVPVQEALDAASVGQSLTQNPTVESEPQPLTEITINKSRERMYDIPEGMEIDERMVVKGTLGDSLLQMETALDRVTWEIARNMQESKVLVVWMLDASGSLKTQREVIAGRLDRIYGELGALQDVGQIPRKRKPLLTGVVTYGERTNFITREPTDKYDVVRDAIAEVQPDVSGKENVFTAVTQTMQMWKGYRATNGRRIMLIVVTDESGDDFDRHVGAIKLMRRYGAQAYVIGPTAVQGRKKGYVPYVAPEDGRTYQLEVDLGPETAMFDMVDLPYWYSGPQYKYLSSGFGPYALSRLVSETGGVYFTTSMTTMEGLSPSGFFSAETMKPFQPDYSFGTIDDYAADLARHPLRYAVVQAARISRENQAEGTPRLSMRVTPANYRQAATTAQQTVARSQLMIDNILEAFPPDVDKLYDQEPSLRWRVAFNLAYGRLLTNRVRCYEYNAALAEMKGGLTPGDIGSKSNEWTFRPSDKVNYATSLRGQAKKAEEYLKRVIAEAPGTPWAVLAGRELQNPPGIRVVQRFIPPPVRRPAAATPRSNQPTARLLLARERQRRAAQQPPPKKKKVVLPRL